MEIKLFCIRYKYHITLRFPFEDCIEPKALIEALTIHKINLFLCYF